MIPSFFQHVPPSLAKGGGRTEVDTSPLVFLNVYLDHRIEGSSVKFIQSMVQSRFLEIVSPQSLYRRLLVIIKESRRTA